MIPNCGILTESIKELGKKHGITNEVYLKALYTRWATMHTNDEVFDDKALLEEMSLDAKKVDTIHLKEFGVIPSYLPVNGDAPGGRISGVDKEGNIKLYRDSINGIEDFLKYISGKTSNSITSQQKKKVFDRLSKEGKDLRYFEDLLKSKKDILAFVLFHEKSHIAHRDIENYDVQDLLGDNQIEIEYRATLDAIEEFKVWKENENKKNIPEKKQTKFNYARYSDNAYEVSSSKEGIIGDSRFSAKYATFKEGTVIFGHDVSGRTIESVYQNGVKQGDWITDSNNKTGAPKNKEIIKGNTEDASYYEGYLPLWQEWARQNPELIEDLRIKASGKTLTDKFASTAVSQARALADILNSSNNYSKQTNKSIHTISNKTAEYGVEIDTRLISNYKNWQANNPNGIVAYRVNTTTFNTPQAVKEGIIGNPFNWQKYGTDKSLEMFYDWLITGNNHNERLATEDFRRAIIDKILSSEDSTPILYYKELNGPSHATIIGYLIANKQLLKSSEQTVKFYTGNITPDENTIFVFGSNPEGRHGAGAAKVAREQFGAEYDVGEGLTGNSYALPTKDLRVKENNGLRSISRESIIESIKKLYEVALQNPNKEFKVAYRNTDKVSLNGYTGFEMMDMFVEAGEIPSNIIFSEEWWKTGKFDKKPLQQSDELPEDIIIKPSPVSADEVTKRDLNTPRAKLNNILPANIQTKRSKLIAKMFYDICNEHIEAKKQEYLDKGDYQTVLEWDSSAVGRAKALRYIDVKSVIEEVYQSFIDNANVSIEEMTDEWRLPLDVAEHRKKHYNIIVDNFATLLEDACPQIEKDCGLRLCITANQVDNGKIKETKLSGTFIRPEDIYDTDPNMQDNEDGARSNGNDGWSYKARHTDPHSTISLATKNVLRQLPRKDSNGNIIYDDLGNEELIDEEFAHAMLIQGLSGMITSEDFCVITQTENGPEYSFPALQQLALKYPWVEEVVDYLIDNPTEIAAFYTDFRNTFIPYYKFKNGKLVAMNQGTTNGSSLILQVKRDYEQGNPLTDNPIYTTMSESNVENIEINNELLKEIQNDLTYVDGEDAESLKPILEKTVKLIRALGFDVDYNDINALWHTGSNNSVFNTVLSSVSTILSKAANAEPSGLITMLNSDYIEIAKNISKVSELENLASFREGDKTYYSYSAPNFADIQIAYFKSDKYRDDYLTENFKQFKWFTDNEGNLRNGWLKLLATDDYVRQNLETIELKNIEGVDYEDWTGDMIDKAFIGAYFSKHKGNSAVKFAYYHYPIFSDSPVAKFIKMPKHGDIKEIIPLLREVVKQELYRIDHVNKRANKGVSKIGNYDKVGRKFCFFPDLNDYKVGNKPFLDACNEQYANEAKQNEIIDSALEAIMERNFLKFEQDTAITAQDLKTWGVDDLTIEEALKEYYYNSVYAETQIIQMTVTDLAYYKDATDFQKRFKEVYAAGKRLYTGSQYGKKFENVIYLADNVKTSTAYDRFKKGLNKALEAGRITKMDYDSILYKFRNVNATDAQGFRTHESYRAILDMMGQWTPVMEDALNKMIKGEWDISHFNVVWQTIKPFLFSTTIKPDGLGDIMKVNHQNKDSEFLLLAVMDMIAADANSPQIKVLNQFMLDNNIDLALYESGCKAGKQGVIDLNYSQAKIAECKKDDSIRVGERVFNLHTDNWNPKLSNFDNFKNQLDEYLDNGTMLQEEYNKVFEEYLPLTEDEMRQVLEESVKTKESQDPRFNRGEKPTEDAWFNPNVVHTFSYEDYMIAQPTPEHLIDAETIFGSQFRNLIISDLPVGFKCKINGVEYNRKEVHDLYNSLIVANLVDSFNRLKGDFNNIHTIQQRLLSMVQGNPKYGRDIIQALEIVKVTNPLTGQKEEVFNIPLNNPSTTEKLQQLILSAFKNSVTKQYIHGGNAILVSDIGYTKELNVVKEKDGTLVGIECYLPATSKAFFEPLLKTVTNTETGEAYQILDFNELDDDLKRAIGYRIPTEQKYSMVPLIIKGFLPQQNGSSIMVAEDVTTLSGCDFDVKIC